MEWLGLIKKDLLEKGVLRLGLKNRNMPISGSLGPHYAFQKGFQLEKPLCRAPRSWVLIPAL